MRAIAKAMGFAPEAWFEENVGGGKPSGRADVSSGISGRLEYLFETVRNPKTGEPYTNAEVARMTLGDLTEEEVEDIKSGAISGPSVSQVSALAAVFGIEPSYLVDRKELPPLDAELLEGLKDDTTREITREALRLPERERKIVLNIVREFKATNSAAG
jgi:hypothetical protein